MFSDNSGIGWSINPGKLANDHHSLFSKKMEYNTLHELDDIGNLQKNKNNNRIIVSDEYNGFHDRNLAVSKSEYIIAFSMSPYDYPIEGGTLRTWKTSKGHKKHFTITG